MEALKAVFKVVSILIVVCRVTAYVDLSIVSVKMEIDFMSLYKVA